MASTKEEFLALDHKLVPFSARFNTQFLYESITYTLGKIYFNESIGCLMTSLTWRIDTTNYSVYGIAIQTGVNIVKQHDTKLPSLVAVNLNDRGANVTEITDLRMYIILEFDSNFLGA